MADSAEVQAVFVPRAAQPFPPSHEDRHRLRRYAENRELYEGDADDVYRNAVRVVRGESNVSVEMYLNIHKRLSTLWGTLVVGEPPTFAVTAKDSAQQDAQQQYLDRLVASTRLIPELFACVIDYSRFGDTLLVVRHDGTKACIEATSPEHWLPIVRNGNLRDIAGHVLWTTYKELVWGQEADRIDIVVYESGKYTTFVCAWDSLSGEVRKVLETKVTTVPTDLPLVYHAANSNATGALTGLDDYKDIDTFVMEINTRLAQNSSILDAHARPKMSGPMSAVQMDPNTGRAKASLGDYVPVGMGEQKPEYIVWNGNIDASMTQIEKVMDFIYLVTETSPAILGRQDAVGAVPSGAALKRMAMATVAKAGRIRMNLEPIVLGALHAAAALDVAQGTEGAVLLDDIAITWQDGLPQDEAEQVDLESKKVLGGISSKRAAVARLNPSMDDKALDEEMAAIQADESMPTVSGGAEPLKFTPLGTGATNAGGQQ